MALNELKFLLKHSSVYGVGTIFAQAAGFLLLPFYTNYLTPTDYGIAALVETSISIIGMVVSFGIGQALTRFFSEQEAIRGKNAVISTTYILTWLICIVFLPLLLLLSVPLSELLFERSDYGRYFMLSSMALFVGFNAEVGFAYLLLKARSTLFVSLSLANTIILIGLNIYFIAFQQMGLLGIFYSSLITKSLLAVGITIPIIVQVGLRFDLRLGLQMIHFSMPLGLSTVLRIMTNESDKFFINYFFSPFETGIYAVAGKIATGVHMMITSTFLQSFQPIRFEIAKAPDGPRTYGVILEQYLLVIGSFGLFIAIFSDDIIRLMTTREFYTAAIFIPPLILSWILFGLKYHMENGILISMKPRYIFYISGASSLANIGLNFLLIPRYGVWGAVLASIVSNLILAGASFVISQRHYRIEIDWTQILKIVLCVGTCFALGTMATQLLRPGLAMAVKVHLSAAYLGTIFYLRIVEADFLWPLKGKIVKSKQ